MGMIGEGMSGWHPLFRQEFVLRQFQVSDYRDRPVSFKLVNPRYFLPGNGDISDD
jgi:hypothetical protein